MAGENGCPIDLKLKFIFIMSDGVADTAILPKERKLDKFTQRKFQASRYVTSIVLSHEGSDILKILVKSIRLGQRFVNVQGPGFNVF